MIRKSFVRNPYNYDVDEESVLSGLKTEGPSLTLQSQGQEADINHMMKKFAVTGVLPQSLRLPSYQSFKECFDYGSALRAVREADQAFMALPAGVRSRFSNDPASFVEFCSHEENLPELRRLGLAPKEKRAAAAAVVKSESVSGRGDKAADSGGADKKRAKSEKDAE